MTEDTVIDNYVRWLETLGPQGVHRLRPFLAKDVRHRTPESEGAGTEAVSQIFASMFEGFATVKTRVLMRMAEPPFIFLRWDRISIRADGTREALSGISELMLDPKGHIASITDYWDTMPEPAPPKGLIARLLKR